MNKLSNWCTLVTFINSDRLGLYYTDTENRIVAFVMI